MKNEVIKELLKLNLESLPGIWFIQGTSIRTIMPINNFLDDITTNCKKKLEDDFEIYGKSELAQ
ncbi:unnamed protein product [Paramecium sonneborni]|uniref:Uncharacterized protein n=1 Tax=Paramecium sonneborni TaxID=65129 RepID=A0A8S1RJS4_9CILI|nr:unnamed protein product [Paramecium sonneborni]